MMAATKTPSTGSLPAGRLARQKLVSGFFDSEPVVCAPQVASLSLGTHQENTVSYWGVTLGCAVAPNNAGVLQSVLNWLTTPVDLGPTVNQIANLPQTVVSGVGYVTNQVTQLVGATADQIFPGSGQGAQNVAVFASIVMTDGASEEGAAASYFEGASYTPKVIAQTGDATDLFHAFPTLVDTSGDVGTVRTVVGGDGSTYQVLEIPGSINGQNGVYQYIKNSDGTINHRLFVPTIQ